MAIARVFISSGFDGPESNIPREFDAFSDLSSGVESRANIISGVNANKKSIVFKIGDIVNIYHHEQLPTGSAIPWYKQVVTSVNAGNISTLHSLKTS